MTDREIMQQAIEAMEYADACLKKQLTTKTKHEYAQDLLMEAGTALRERLAQPNEFNPDWDAMAVMVEEQQRMATEIDNLKRRLKAVNTAAMTLASDLTCMEVDDDERLDRARVMERVMRWRNEWDKAMHNSQSQMQPCAGRNCGSTNPNLHSAECFEDYEQSTGMNQWQGLTDDEIEHIADSEWEEAFVRMIEAKLKEKNT